jgi:hypothetical protein
VGVGVGVAPGVDVGVGVGQVGTIVLGKMDGVGDGVGAMHSVPGRYSSFSDPAPVEPEVGDGDGDGDPEGEMLALFWQAVPSTNPLGRWKLSTLKLAWLRPLLMKSRRTELPTMVP